MLLDVRNIEKIYTTRFSKQRTVALRNVSFSVEKGEFIAIMGESGSGKTTLLNILSTLDQPTAGEVVLNGQLLSNLKDKEVAAFRRERLGFVFQDFNLLDTLSIRDNIYLPLVLSRIPQKEMEARIAPLAKMLGIYEQLDKYPFELSGGQRQRASVARAMIVQPEIVLADEPTGALDSKASGQLLDSFTRLHEEGGQTILMVTHSVLAASYANRVLFIKDGIVFHEIYKGERSRDLFGEEISKSLQVLNRESQ